MTTDTARSDWWRHIRPQLKTKPWQTIAELAKATKLDRERIKLAFDAYSGYWESRARKVPDGVRETEFAAR